MVNGIFKRQKLEELLQHNWGDFLDHLQLMRRVLEDVRNTPFRELKQQNIPQRHVKFSVTKICALPSNFQQSDLGSAFQFEFWVEYTIPKDDGVVVGTNTYLLSLDGNLKLGECFGTHFKTENS